LQRKEEGEEKKVAAKVGRYEGGKKKCRCKKKKPIDR
jgi:hypothetical protein